MSKKSVMALDADDDVVQKIRLSSPIIQDTHSTKGDGIREIHMNGWKFFTSPTDTR